MILLANFLIATARIIHMLFMIYIWIVIIRALLSWIRIPALYPLSFILYHLTEPVLRPLRKFFPPSKMGGIDISPFIIILLILFVDSFLVQFLSLYAQQLLRHQTLSF